MKINIEFLSMPIVTKIVGSKTLTLDFPGETINDLVNQIVHYYGEKLRHFLLDESSKLDRAFMIHLNRKEWIRRDQLDQPLKDGDQVTLMMLVGGG
jgi:molybdopterin converting factor small subunit